MREQAVDSDDTMKLQLIERKAVLQEQFLEGGSVNKWTEKGVNKIYKLTL